MQYELVWLYGDPGTPREQGEPPQIVNASTIEQAVIQVATMVTYKTPTPSGYALIDQETGKEVYRTGPPPRAGA